jgi:hypothetical protein
MKLQPSYPFDFGIGQVALGSDQPLFGFTFSKSITLGGCRQTVA